MDLLSSAYDSAEEEDPDSQGGNAGFSTAQQPLSGTGKPACSVQPPHVAPSPPKSTKLSIPEPPLNLASATRSALGYVSKRKRKAQNKYDGADSADIGPSSTVNCLSPYLAEITQNASVAGAKRARLKLGVPKSKEAVFVVHSKPVLSLEWHPNIPSILLSASLDGTVRLLDVEHQWKGCVSVLTPHEGEGARDVEWVSSETALSGGYDRSAVLTDIGYGKELVRLKHSAYVSLIKAHPTDKNLALTGDFDGRLQLWDLRTSKSAKNFKGAGGKILAAVFLPSGGSGADSFVASSDIVRKNSFSQAVNVWDVGSGVTLTQQLYFEPFTCPCLRLHPGGEEFMAQSNGNYIVLFSAKKPFKWNKRKRFQGHYVSGFDVGFDVSPDGGVVCSASAEGKVYFYDYFSTKLIRSQKLCDCSCLSVAWSELFPFRVAVSDWNGKIYVLQCD